MQTPSNYILETSKEYSIYVATSRAIPQVTDGLKDGQRKALWLLRNRAEKIKTFSLTGALLESNLYVHGDTSASDTIGKLAAPYLNNIPLIEGIGAFGTKVAPDSIGAPRYTYVKRSKFAEHFLYADMDLVPTQENYDGSNIQPITFLPLIPLVLLNGVSGIAVGWSTEILPRNINDLINATQNALKGLDIAKLIPNYQNYNIKVKNIADNSWEFSGKLKIIDSSSVKITELPPNLSLEQFKDRLDSLEDENKINGYTDNSTDNINIDVKFKRGSIVDWKIEDAINFFKLRSKKTERIVVVDWNCRAIRTYVNAEDLVKDFAEWRFNYYIKRYENLLKNAQVDYTFNSAIIKCFDDNLPSVLSQIENKQELMELIREITKEFSISNDEIDKLSSFASYRWTKEYYIATIKRIKELEASIKKYQNLLKNPKKIKDIYIDELETLKGKV